MTETRMIRRTTVTEKVAARDAALKRFREAAELRARSLQAAHEAEDYAKQAHEGAQFYDVDHARQEAYRAAFARFDVEESVEAFRRSLDARTWMHLIELTNIRRLMDRTAMENLRKDLSSRVPEVTEDNVIGMTRGLVEEAGLIFQRGLARVFSELDPRFRSHDAFKIGSRIILTGIFTEDGYWNYHRDAEQQIGDVERVLAVLDKEEPDVGALIRLVNEGRRGYGPRQGYAETPYLRIRTFKNGNAHLWFTRDDLVEKANKVLADYYGAVLPDAVPEDVDERDLRGGGALSRDLAYYPTPPAVVAAMFRDVYVNENSCVLEPSAGTGNITVEALKRGAIVEAVEVHHGRFEALSALMQEHKYLTTHRANFLQMPARPIFSHVLMNPPFAGTHWMEHVVHAFDFLAPRGVLVAVLPVSAELGETKKHRDFRAWAERHGNKRYLFHALPQESFASSGTRVSTVILTLHK